MMDRLKDVLLKRRLAVLRTHLESWEFSSGTGHDCVVEVDFSTSETIENYLKIYCLHTFPKQSSWSFNCISTMTEYQCCILLLYAFAASGTPLVLWLTPCQQTDDVILLAYDLQNLFHSSDWFFLAVLSQLLTFLVLNVDDLVESCQGSLYLSLTITVGTVDAEMAR